jgi:FkbM family methyltransferase
LRNPLFSLLQKIYHAVGGHGLGRLKPLRFIYGLLFRWFLPRSVQVQGHQMWLDDQDTLELATHPLYEPLETDLFKKEIRPGDIVLDIGANIGYYTLIAARLVGSEGRVYAFEPDPTNFQLLQKNIQANGYQNIRPLNRAVSSRAGEVSLYLNPSNRGDHRIYDSGDGRTSVKVQTLRLDDFFKPLEKKVHFIKMDIQGAEFAALTGMKGLIRKSNGLKLVTEFSPGALQTAGAKPARYLQDLLSLGFRLFEISEKGKSIHPVTSAQLLNRPWGGAEEYTNLYCVKSK